MCKKKFIAILLCLFSLFFICSCNNQQTFDIRYKITNLAGLEDASMGQGLIYNNTFKVSGTITIKNYNTDMIVVTAEAIGESDNYIPIFTTINIVGDGSYDFEMTSFYKNSVDWITKIVDFEVKDV